MRQASAAVERSTKDVERAKRHAETNTSNALLRVADAQKERDQIALTLSVTIGALTRTENRVRELEELLRAPRIKAINPKPKP